MVIAVERCLCVALPTRAATLIRTRTMVVIMVTIVVSLQLLCIVYPFKFDVFYHYDGEVCYVRNLPTYEGGGLNITPPHKKT